MIPLSASPSAEKLLERARVRLLCDHPFFGHLAMQLRWSESVLVPTMGTDGKLLLWNRSFVESLPAAELRGVLVHELLHACQGHGWRRKARDPERWNIACDAVVNPLVLASGHTLPAGAIAIPELAGLAAEEAYARLPESNRDGDGRKTGSGSGNCNGDGGAPGGFSDPAGTGGVFDYRDPETGERPSEAETAALDAEMQVTVAQAATLAKARGTLPAAIARLVGELLEPQVDWRALLRATVQARFPEDFTWRKPSRRSQAAGLYLPSTVAERTEPLVFAIDTSGSIDDSELTAYLAEARAVWEECRPSAMHLLFADAAVARTVTLTEGDPWPSPAELQPVGGGGTDFRPTFRWVAEHAPDCRLAVYLTDLLGRFPAALPPGLDEVLWLATTDLEAPFGQTVRLHVDR